MNYEIETGKTSNNMREVLGPCEKTLKFSAGFLNMLHQELPLSNAKVDLYVAILHIATLQATVMKN